VPAGACLMGPSARYSRGPEHSTNVAIAHIAKTTKASAYLYMSSSAVYKQSAMTLQKCTVTKMASFLFPSRLVTHCLARLGASSSEVRFRGAAVGGGWRRRGGEPRGPAHGVKAVHACDGRAGDYQPCTALKSPKSCTLQHPLQTHTPVVGRKHSAPPCPLAVRWLSSTVARQRLGTDEAEGMPPLLKPCRW
jgi:hypothetical protein